jgi:hypothetical protein
MMKTEAGRKATVSVVMLVPPSVPTERICVKIDIESFYLNLSTCSVFGYSHTTIVTFHEDLRIFMTTLVTYIGMVTLITKVTVPVVAVLVFVTTVTLVINITNVSVVIVVILATMHTLISKLTSVCLLLWLCAKSISLCGHSVACCKQLPEGLKKQDNSRR